MKIHSFTLLIIVIASIGGCVGVPTFDATLLPNATTTTPQIVASTTAPSPSSLPLQTLSPDDSITFISNLLQQNAGCRLPCWWGITPGETSWVNAREFLGRFVTNIGGGISLYESRHGKSTLVSAYGVSYPVPNRTVEGSTNFFVDQNIVYRMVVSSEGTELLFQLNQLLREYGSPDEVWLQGWPYNDSREPAFALFIMYDEQGIAARYEGDATIISESQMQICPKSRGPILLLWNPNDGIPLEAIEEMEHRWDAPDYKLIEDSTEMANESFYQLMKDSQACFNTLVDLWDE